MKAPVPSLPKTRVNRLSLEEAIRAAGPPLLFGIRLWASVCLALYVAFWLELDNPSWAGTSAAIVCQPQLGASLRKGWFRMNGTLIGAVAAVALAAVFPQDRIGFLLGLALWGGACALVSTVLHNFAAYAAALAGYTTAIIAGDLFGPTGGTNAETFTLALTRFTEIGIGIVSAGVVLTGTDLGAARRRLAALFVELAMGITSDFARMLAGPRPGLPDTQNLRREYLRRVIALDPVIDQTIGESSQIRYHSPVLQRAVDGFFIALSGWRAIGTHLLRLPDGEARTEAADILRCLPPELGPVSGHTEPVSLHSACNAAARRLVARSTPTASARLLADQSAEVLAGLSYALNGLALLVADPARRVARTGFARLRVPDWFPALLNGGRAFVTIGVVALFWIVTAWPNGAGAVTWSAVAGILFAARSEQTAAMIGFFLGTMLSAICAAIVAFAVLPGLGKETFTALAIVLACYLIPTGALMAQPWQTGLFTAMTANFVPLLAPANPMSYDTVQFYNAASALVAGIGAAVLGFTLIPPLSPAFRTRRLLKLTLRDLRRLAIRPTGGLWEGKIYGRLAAMPDAATPLQRAWLMTALSVGSNLTELREVVGRLGLSAPLGPALIAVAQGRSAEAVAHLARLDAALAAREGASATAQAILRARGRLLAVSEALTTHAVYFDGGADR